MATVSGYIPVGKGQLHYTRSGSGARILLVFHGYGHEGESMHIFEKHLSKEFTCYFFDLPHHGKSVWDKQHLLQAGELAALVETLMKTHRVKKISLLGYSIGGRVCLSIIGAMPQYIQKATLLAPDGLRTDPYYYFFTKNFAGKLIFRQMVENPVIYYKLINFLRSKNLLGESRYKFVMRYLDDEKKRRQLGEAWPVLAELVTGKTYLREIIKEYRIPVTIFMGKYDRVIAPPLAKKFCVGLDTVQLHILEKGHRVYDAHNAAAIAQTLL